MNIEIVKNEKNELEVKLDNLTVAEILREYLNKDSDVELAAWKREHYERPLLFKIKTKGKKAKKALDDAVEAVKKDADEIVKEVKKAK